MSVQERERQENLKRELSLQDPNIVSPKGDTSSYMADSIKRLAISHDGHAVPAGLSAVSESSASIEVSVSSEPVAHHHNNGLRTVLSTASDHFYDKYDLVKEIGKGGFSTVHQCREKRTGRDFAVKVSFTKLNVSI